jgi:hypothetical protein
MYILIYLCKKYDTDTNKNSTAVTVKQTNNNSVNTKTGRPGTCANYRIVDERKVGKH